MIRVIIGASSFVFDPFRNRKPVKLLKKGCVAFVARCSENKTCSELPAFLHQVKNRSSHKERIATV